MGNIPKKTSRGDSRGQPADPMMRAGATRPASGLFAVDNPRTTRGEQDDGRTTHGEQQDRRTARGERAERVEPGFQTVDVKSSLQAEDERQGKQLLIQSLESETKFLLHRHAIDETLTVYRVVINFAGGRRRGSSAPPVMPWKSIEAIAPTALEAASEALQMHCILTEFSPPAREDSGEAVAGSPASTDVHTGNFHTKPITQPNRFNPEGSDHEKSGESTGATVQDGRVIDYGTNQLNPDRYLGSEPQTAVAGKTADASGSPDGADRGGEGGTAPDRDASRSETSRDGEIAGGSEASRDSEASPD